MRGFRFGKFLRQIPIYTQQTEVLLIQSEHIFFIVVALKIQNEVLTRILSEARGEIRAQVRVKRRSPSHVNI